MALEDDEQEPALEPEADLDWFGEDEPAESAEDMAEAPEWLTATAALQNTVDASEAEGWLAEEIAASAPEAEDVQESVEVMLLDEGEEEAVPDWMTEEQLPEPLGDLEFDPLAAMDAAEEALTPVPEDSEAAYEVRELGELVDDGDVASFGSEGEAEAENEEADVWSLEAEPYADIDDEDMPIEAEAEADDYFAAFEDAPEAAEIAPAPNAPDWLNAMVPGLDIDYEAPEDEPLETAFEIADEGELEPTMPEDFGWVNEIVEEETRPEPALESAQARAPRFVFSRPPVWLRRLFERGPEQPPENDDDLPAWLR
ncbi:MAG: hypothetical protein IH582_14025 [Afipia sp.]|nr:hypothetical protein [Afipia sp.]